MSTATVAATLQSLGRAGLFSLSVLRASLPTRDFFAELTREIYKIGGRSLPIIAVGGAFVGLVLTLQGYRTLIAMMPSKDIGVVVLWNSESGTPSGLMPMVMDRALGLSPRTWVRVNGLNLGEIEADDAVPQSGNQTGAQRDPLGEFIRNNVDNNRQ